MADKKRLLFEEKKNGVISQGILVIICMVIFLLLLILGLGLGLGLGLQISSLKNDVSMLRTTLTNTRIALDQSIMDVVMNTTSIQEFVLTSGNYTVEMLQPGNFPPYPTQFSTPTPFELKQVLVGPLNFTLLKLYPPSPLLTSPLVIDWSRFTMIIPTLIPFNFNNAFGLLPFPYIPVGPANVARLNMPCLQQNTCIMTPDETLSPAATDLYFNAFQIESEASQDYIILKFVIFPGTSSDLNWNFTWTEPLQLILPVL